MANYSFSVWIALSVGLLLLFVYTALVNVRRHNQPEVRLDDIVTRLLPVDLEALAAALDLGIDSSLRPNSPEEFRKLERERAKVAAECLRRMRHNAALLQRLGYSRLNSPNPMVVEQAQQLVDAGVHVRIYVLMALAAMFVRRIWGLGSLAQMKVARIQRITSSSLLPAYEALRSKAADLTGLRDQGFHESLLQSL
jgi:hypothetical protein